MRPIALLAVVLVGLTSCGGADESGWTVREAESVRSVRGMPLHVLSCRGLNSGRERRFTRFACVAGARKPGERFDTVGVFYDLVLLEDARYRLEKVKFIGGPGIP